MLGTVKAPAPVTERRPQSFTLEDRYTAESGTVIMTGTQALARLALDQQRADRARGLNTAGFISGYRGSPLGAFDTVLERIPQLLAQHQIRFLPAVNEELAATAVMGSQTANLLPQPKYDGVCGMWYGKGPGVDRSGDAFKHANLAGVGRNGGVLALAGDDPSCKSSTIPSHSEAALYDAMMPILYPGSAQEILDMGLYGFALSRFSGLWVGVKIVSDVADEFSSVEVGAGRLRFLEPDFRVGGRRWRPRQNTALLSPHSLEQERQVQEERLEAALAFAGVNPPNRIAVRGERDWLGIIAAGKTWYDLRGALRDIGLDDRALQRAGIRLLKLGLIYPLAPELLGEFADGLDEILVIEEKRAFIETLCKEALYGSANMPRIYGKKDDKGERLTRADYELDADEITRILGRFLRGRINTENAEAAAPRLERRLREIERAGASAALPILGRQPYFCSGCPHNRSTVVPAGSLAGAGIGCHTLAILMERDTAGVTQMGGEGANWVGAETFTDMPHLFQNIGDGTFAHSGSLSIRQATAAGTRVTFKILYNSAVAMTGGQAADGLMPVPELTHLLYAEGVKKTIVVSAAPDEFPPAASWAPGAEVWGRERLEEAQLLLRGINGVTALVYDQECAANLRRKRRRGYVPDPALRVVINEAVCEGCGDCGAASNCLSVQPVDTEFGRKTQIHQSSCNKDYTCLEGNCPAFITVLPGEVPPPAAKPPFQVPRPLPAPARRVNGSANILLMGIGGTGVVTANQVLGTAAALDGFYVRALDQTGLSQKGGPVVSHLKIAAEPLDAPAKIGAASTDAFLVFDALTAAERKNLQRAHPQRSVAIVSTSKVPTGAMVRDTAVEYPQADRILQLINQETRAGDNVYFDAISLAERLFGDHMMANFIIIGAAYQTGSLPMSDAAIEQAIALNGVMVAENQQAFRAGRLAVADANWLASVQEAASEAASSPPALSPAARSLLGALNAEGELARLAAARVPELIVWGSEADARAYIDDIKRVMRAEQAARPGATALSEAVARYLFKLMAYKDEYEVARLSLKPELDAALAAQFGARARIHYHLQPPLLKALGLKRKIKLGAWFKLVYRALYRLRFLRGSALDIFGYDRLRRLERDLISQYRRLIFAALDNLEGEHYERALELARAPDIIRGYDEVKLRNIERYWQKLRALGYD